MSVASRFEDLDVQEAKAPPPRPTHRAATEADLAYRVQGWTRRMFKGEVQTGGQLAAATLRREEGQWHAFCRELFGRLYGVGCRRLEEPRDGAEWANELHNQADAIPEWKGLEGRVNGDPWRAGIGAAVAASVLATKVPELPKEDAEALQAEADILKEFMEGKDGKRRVNQKLLKQRAGLQKRIAKARAQAQDAVDKIQGDGGLAIRSALREAANEANKQLQELDDGMEGLGCGSNMAPLQRRAIAVQMAKNPKLRQIAMLAGRLRKQAAQKQRTKVNREREEMHGVTTGDDLQRLLASEVGLLPKADTRLLLMGRIADKRALQYELRGRESKTRGPIVFCIDTSGSMGGHREIWSKACALACMEIARIQKRAFAILYFNQRVVGEFKFDPRNLDMGELLKALEYFSGGGTNVQNALKRAHTLITDKDWRPGRKADVVVVSDGDDRSNVHKPAEKIRNEGATIYTIAIDHEPQQQIVEASAEVVRINRQNMGGTSDKLDVVFSL